MAINPSGAVAVPLNVFGSWCTEPSPNALPENVSPDCQEVIYGPGFVGSRPGFERLFAAAFPAGGPDGYVPTVVYSKSFVTPTGDIRNLYFDSNGSLWVVDQTNSPTVLSLLLASTSGACCKSLTAFGREYIAVSNGLLGADVPVQYDGTYLDRLTMDAPAASPNVAMQAFPAVAMAIGTPPSPVTVTTARTINPIQTGPPGAPTTVWTGILVDVVSTVGFIIGQTFTISGNTQTAFNVSLIIYGIQGNGLYCNFYSTSNLTGTGGTATVAGSISMSRANNQVSITAASAHQLQVGFQALIAGAGSLTIGGGITDITINNEDNPGIATITTTDAHGLVPDLDVTITGVTPVDVGGATNWSAVRSGGLVTLTLGTGTHSLVPGGVVQTSASSNASLNTSATIALVPSPTQIAFYQTIDADVTTPVTGITVSLTWPVPDNTLTPTYFTVLSAPTPTTFQVQVSYSDGEWSSGAVGFPWDGTFYVTAVPSATTAIYQQYGPAGTNNTTSATVTPWGQMAPGLHLCQVLGLDRQGGITACSPPTTFIANGGQYPVISNIPLMPPNFVARILAFTGAQPNVPGTLPPFFYIPVPAQTEGLIVSTATQINDNTTTSILLDFSDNTLFAGLGISIPGNTLANQIVLDGALSFGKYQSRLLTWGQRNTVQNLLNMGFDGGVLATNTTVPLGWNTSQSGLAYLNPGRIGGWAWAIETVARGIEGTLSQSGYQDVYGDPILSPNTAYTVRFWAKQAGITTGNALEFFIGSVTTSMDLTVSIAQSGISTTGEWYELTFPITPGTIPADVLFGLQAITTTVDGLITIDDLSLFPTLTPQLGIAYGSYVNNPAAFDGVTGQFGPEDDTRRIMDMGIIRDTLYMVTQDPSGRLHETNGSGVTEPSGWEVKEVAANCGTLSAFGLTHSQADDTAASGGDNWLAWPSETGVMLFSGASPEKISQEIQPNWNDPSRANTAIQINMAAATSIWGLNDPVQRLLLFGLPIGNATAPSRIYVLDYKNLNSAYAIASSPPFHPSLSGHLIATDNSRKWAPWNRPINYAARMYLAPGQLTLVLCGGNGWTPGTAQGYGNVYTLNPALLTDDDYGQIASWYTTYAFLDPEKAQALGLKGQRLLMAYATVAVKYTGQVTLTYFPENLSNPWPLATTRSGSGSANFDLEFGGGMCTGNRIFVRISSSPITGTDNGFLVSRFTAFLKDAKLLVRGANQ